MILTRARVLNFRCVRDSGWFRIDESVTSLVGKNESGKTALLHALRKLNDVDDDGEFDELDFPRMLWNEYKARKDVDPAPAVQTEWALEPEDVSALQDVIGESFDPKVPITVSKGYSNRVTYSLKIDERAVVSHLLDNHELLADERTPIEAAASIKELGEELAKLAGPTQRQSKLKEHLKATFGDSAAITVAVNLLHQRLPRFVYFSEYYTLPGQVSLKDLRSRPADQLRDRDRAFLAFLGFVGTTAEALEKTGGFEKLQAELEAASSRLTRDIFKYWTQNKHLRVVFRFDPANPSDSRPFNEGFIFRTRIENTRHGSTTSFDDRSAGFVWFFSFLIWFSQAKKNHGERLVFLLDEPGLGLHAKAQDDLLRYIEEKLAPTYQVIYTTHSPSMIDARHLERARTVEDVFLEIEPGNPVEERKLGTKVGDEVLSTDRDTLSALQRCLGLQLSQTLFVGKHNLLLEGPSDLLYVRWFQERLRAQGRPTLDRRWTPVPCGGVTKVAAFVSLFGANDLDIAVVSDIAPGKITTEIARLRASKLLKDGRVLTLDGYSGKPEADIEDLLGDDFYAALVNRAFALSGPHAVSASAGVGQPSRVVKRVEEHFRTLPTTIPDSFDHYRPADFLVTLTDGSQLPGFAGACDRFERLFKDLNAMLPLA
jgi:predicted ATP-dependent endonuclease of OLD family